LKRIENDQKRIFDEKKLNFALNFSARDTGIIILEHALHGSVLYFVHYNNPFGRVTRLMRQCFTPHQENREHGRLDFGWWWDATTSGKLGGGVE